MENVANGKNLNKPSLEEKNNTFNTYFQIWCWQMANPKRSF